MVRDVLTDRLWIERAFGLENARAERLGRVVEEDGYTGLEDHWSRVVAVVDDVDRRARFSRAACQHRRVHALAIVTAAGRRRLGRSAGWMLSIRLSSLFGRRANFPQKTGKQDEIRLMWRDRGVDGLAKGLVTWKIGSGQNRGRNSG